MKGVKVKHVPRWVRMPYIFLILPLSKKLLKIINFLVAKRMSPLNKIYF